MSSEPDYITVVLNGIERRVNHVTCCMCSNEFIIFMGVEFLPRFCPYCGKPFTTYGIEGKGIVDTGGRPVE